MAIRQQGTAPLRDGERLSREEFHRRYEACPKGFKAELVEGVVYVPSPVRIDAHGDPLSLMIWWVGVYKEDHDDVRVPTDTTVLLDDINEVQPDVFMFLTQPPGEGAARVNADNYVEGAPQLIIEVSGSSVRTDLGRKLEAYQRNGVLEYIVWRTLDGAVDWRRLVDGRYVLIAPDARGMIESAVFPGLRLDVPALLRSDRRALRAALQHG